MVEGGSMGKRNGWGVRENAYGRRGEGTIEGEGWRWVNKWKKGKEDLSKEFLVDLKRLGQLLIWREREGSVLWNAPKEYAKWKVRKEGRERGRKNEELKEENEREE